MSQNTDNTWSATEANEKPQDIAKLVSMQKIIFFPLSVNFCVMHHGLIFL